VTTFFLPRRAVVGCVLAASLVGTGLIAAFAEDAASGCATWTDPKGDSTTGQGGVPGSEDSNMDIVAAGLSAAGDNLVGTITTDGLIETSSDAGDEFAFAFKVAGVNVTVYADRWVQGTGVGPAVPVDAGTAGILNDDDANAPSGEATVAYDVKSKTVTITGKLTELAKAVAKPVAGQAITDIVASSSDTVSTPIGAAPALPYDDAASKTGLTVGGACGDTPAAPAAAPSAEPSPSASPSNPPAASPAPGGAPAAAGMPAADCFLTKDPKGDASVGVVNGAPGLPNDPDLDITSLTLGTDAKNLNAYIKVDKLDAGPASTDGHRFTVYFTHNKHVFALAGSAYANAQNGQIRDGLASTGQFSHVTQLSVDGKALTDPAGRTAPGFVDSGLKFTFDLKNSYVIASLPLADIDKNAKAPAAGATFTGVYAISAADTDAISNQADVAPDGSAASAPGKLTYRVGDNTCFAPAVPPLVSVGAAKAQYGDVAPVAAKLVDAAGAPVAGKTVTFTLGTAKATGVTGADGIAKGPLTVKDKAGTRALAISAEGATTSATFTVLIEKTALKAVSSKGMITATLTDDDKKPVPGQTISFTSGSKKVTAKTDSKGVAKVSGLPAGRITVSYAGATGMYTAAGTTTKA
jgi:hypothetical protein